MTYGNRENLDVLQARLVFLLGLSLPGIQNGVNEEAQEFDDIIQGNFVDNYYNMTLKRLSSLQWIYLKCSQSSKEIPELVLIADDDYILNIGLALRLADAYPNVNVFGYPSCSDVYRYGITNPRLSKWYLPRYILASKFHLSFLSGATSILRSALIPSLLAASLTIPLHHIDDAYVYEILLDAIQEPLLDLANLFHLDRRELDACEIKRWIMTKSNSGDDMLYQWSKLLKSLSGSCSLATSDFATLLPHSCFSE